jgi:DNA-binding transcriptional ArsR family regulator
MSVDLAALQTNSQQAAELLKTVGNPHRLMILCSLAEREMSVGELNARVELSQSPLSQHLAVLRRAGLVSTRREGQTIYYTLRGSNVEKLMRCLHEIFCA